MMADLRCEMWTKMAAWLRNGCLPECAGLMEELCAPTFWYADNGKKRLEPNDEIKKRLRVSPDLASALSFTFAAPVQKLSDAAQYSKNYGMCTTFYDVLE
jgi:hypothetical protein